MVALRPSPRLVTRLCLAAVVANAVIVVTGALVRLTGSGLGCPTWPRCTPNSYVTTRASGIHGLIEFGNRTLTFVLSVIVIACIVATLRQRPRRRPLVVLSWLLLAGILAQAVLGGITVLTHLNPWTVAAHFLLSAAVIAAAVALHVRSREPDGPTRPVVRPQLRSLGWAVVGVTAVVLTLGTVVTGSGPHAGDRSAPRTGFDPVAVTQLHADAAMLLVGLTVAFLVALRTTGAPRRTQRTAAALVAVEIGQAAVGYLQYFTGLPVPIVAVHVTGACLAWVAAVYLGLSLRERPGVGGSSRATVSAAPGAVPAR